MKVNIFQSLIVIAMLFGTTFVDAEVYKWVDATGAVHFSDKPDHDEAEKLKVKSQRTDYKQLSEQKQTALDEQLTTQAQARQQQEQLDVENQNTELRQENCRRANEALNSLMSAQRLYIPGANGERRYLTDNEIAQRRTKAQQDVDEWCDLD